MTKNARYSRQTAIEEFGIEGQKRLSDSKVLILGCGALGSLIAMQLCGAGIGEICIIDFDQISISNLHRQLFYTTEEEGQFKVKVLKKRMEELNPEVKVVAIQQYITESLAKKLFKDYDFIVDASDNYQVKKMVERVCGDLNLPCSIGGVAGFRGQILTILPSSEKITDIFQETPGYVLPCMLEGVMGPTASLCASIQSSETLKYLSGTGNLLKGRIFIFDLLKNEFHTFEI